MRDESINGIYETKYRDQEKYICTLPFSEQMIDLDKPEDLCP